MRQAVILVGGRGTRLGALAHDTPKPLVGIQGDLCFLDYLIDHVARHGIEEILLLAGHLSEQVIARYDGKRVRNSSIQVRAEKEPNGTGGALTVAADRLDDTFLMLNGDSYFDINFLDLPLIMSANDVGALALRRVPDGRRYGRVQLNDTRISGFHEKDENFTGPALISAGIYVLRKSVLRLIEQLPCSIETDIFPQLVKQQKLSGCIYDGYFIDIGLPETLADARRTLPARVRRGAIFFDRDNTLTRDDSGYTFKPEALQWMPGAIEAIRACNDAGLLAIVVTNQSGVARGFYTERDVRQFHGHMQKHLAQYGAHIDAFYACPFHGEGVVAPYIVDNHPDRKPNPGMTRRAMLEWPIDVQRSVAIGDKASDVIAAERAGIKGDLVGEGALLKSVQEHIENLTAPVAAARNIASEIKRSAAQSRSWLFDDALPLWWRNGFDHTAKCFHERLDLDGSPLPLPRRVRVQARQTFVFATAGRMGWGGPWQEAVTAGLNTLLKSGLSTDGAPIYLLDQTGEPIDSRHDLYDAAFILFALAHAGAALSRPAAFEAAGRLIQWMDQHWAHEHGGYREGEIVSASPRRQNPHMHLLEAFLALYEATGNRDYLTRANSIADLFSTRFLDRRFGALPEYFTDDWCPVADESGRIAEPGHQCEWAWLLCRLAQAGGRDLRPEAENLRIHSELYGVDLKTGATWDEIWLEGMPRKASSRLWPHTERLKANIVRYERTCDPRAGEAALQAFNVILKYLDAPTPGLWRENLSPRGEFLSEPVLASSLYHVTLAFSELCRVADQ